MSQEQQPSSGEVTTEGRWFGPAGEASFGWLSRRVGAGSRSGVLVLPPAGYPWWSSYHTLRGLAERLAAMGHSVLRLHYHATGNAAGSQWESGRLDAWRDSVRLGAGQLRAAGCDTLTLIGVGLGATLALQMATELDARAVAAWRPVINGRREARGLRMRSLAVPDTESATGTIAFAGTVFDAELLAGIAAIDLLASDAWPERVLLVDSPDSGELVTHLQATGIALHRVDTQDGDQALSVAAEEAILATGVIREITDWIGGADPEPEPARTAEARHPAGVSSTEFGWEGARVREQVVQVGPHRLIGIETTPATDAAPLGTVVLLNSGSEPHNGAGNVWTELARHLAVHGHRSLRIDWRGWGESPDDGFAPGRAYDPHAIPDTIEIIDALRARERGPITLIGLCAGAWIALKATLQQPAERVIALNPQLFWTPGTPAYAIPEHGRQWREPTRIIEEQGRISGRWDQLDRAGDRDHGGRWLDQLAASPTHATLLFARGDTGIEYLHNRLARRVTEHTTTGAITVHELDEIDHPMHRAWLRPIVFTAVRHALSDTHTTPTTTAPPRP